MTIAWNTNLPQSYVDLRYAVKRLFEGFGPRPYLDSVGIPTVGVGFNLRSCDVRDEVLFELGFRRDGGASAAELAYKNQIAAAVWLTYMGGQAATHLQPNIDAILTNWANDAAVTTRDGRPKRSTLTLTEAASRLILRCNRSAAAPPLVACA